MGSRKVATDNLKKARAAKTSPGRKPGSKNKINKSVIERILAVEENLASEGKGLEDCAKQDPKWFYEKIFRYVIPRNVNIGGEEGEPLELIIRKV